LFLVSVYYLTCAKLGWGKKDPESKIHNQEVQECTKYLLLNIIPSFAARLLEDSEVIENLTSEMHLDGINVRHMGLIRSLVLHATSKPEVRTTAESVARNLLCEMVRLFYCDAVTIDFIHRYTQL